MRKLDCNFNSTVERLFAGWPAIASNSKAAVISIWKAVEV